MIYRCHTDNTDNLICVLCVKSVINLCLIRSMRIRKGDTVLIITGKDKSKKGKVLRTLPQEGKIVVEGLNIVKKHRQPRRVGEKGQTVEISKPIDVSNVKLICTRCGEPTRVGYKVTESEKVRICKKCGSEL